MPNKDVSALTRPRTKRRYVTLDGLRGVAALVVVLFHCRDLGMWGPSFGYLSVDLFFLLSGFVLSVSYDARFGAGMKTAEFLRLRIIRLYPLYLLGLMLGACAVWVNKFVPNLDSTDVVLALVLNLFVLPSYAVPRTSLLFPLDVPFWSLFFELWVANLLFAILGGKLDRKWLATIVTAGAAGVLISQRTFYHLNVGPSWPDFFGGFARVCFSFFGGVAIARFHSIRPPRFRLPSWLFVAALPVLLALPLGYRAGRMYELLIIFFVFPCMVYFGAEAVERKPWLGEALGDASYAAYTIHYPLLTLLVWSLSLGASQPGGKWEPLFVLLIVTSAWGLNFLDKRVRTVLSGWVGTQRKAAPQIDGG